LSGGADDNDELLTSSRIVFYLRIGSSGNRVGDFEGS
jgi:hypothetical protein